MVHYQIENVPRFLSMNPDRKISLAAASAVDTAPGAARRFETREMVGTHIACHPLDRSPVGRVADTPAHKIDRIVGVEEVASRIDSIATVTIDILYLYDLIESLPEEHAKNPGYH